MEVKLGTVSLPHVGEDVRRHYGEVYGEMLRELGGLPRRVLRRGGRGGVDRWHRGGGILRTTLLLKVSSSASALGCGYPAPSSIAITSRAFLPRSVRR